MRLTLKNCTLPLLALLLGAAAACSEGSTNPAGGGGGDDNQGEGGKSASSGGATAQGGGVAAQGGSTSAFSKCFDFATSTEGWTKTYAQVFSAADKTVRDETASAALLSNTTVDWINKAGYGGDNGYAQLTIPYNTTQNEYQGLLYAFLPQPAVDLTGKKLYAYVKLVEGMTADDPSKPSGAKLIVKSGADYFYADGGWVNLSKGEWKEITLDMKSPNLDQSKDASLFDPTDIREISVEFDTSGSATSVVSPGIVLLDHICY